MKTESLEVMSEDNPLFKIVSLMYGSKKSNLIFGRAQEAFHHLIKRKYGDANDTVNGYFVDYPPHLSVSQISTIWGKNYSGNIELKMPKNGMLKNMSQLVHTNLSYTFKGAIKGKYYEEVGGIFYIAQDGFIFNATDAFLSEHRNEESETHPYFCLMIANNDLNNSYDTKIVPHNRAFFVEDKADIIEYDANEISHIISRMPDSKRA